MCFCTLGKQNVQNNCLGVGYFQALTRKGKRGRKLEVVVTILHLLINLDRGPCCETTNDLHMQQRYSGHYIRTSQIIVAIAALKCEVASLPQPPIAFDRIT